jgi:hypothetical protein
MVRLAWFLLALIHALPAIALVRPSLLTTLYGVEPDSPAYTLLWHRAALFAVILLICCWAAIRPEVRHLAVVALTVSMIGFLIIYWVQGMPEDLRSIAIADLIGLPLLAFVGWSAFRG